MNILVLGGTADGRRLAEQLSQLGVNVLYSIAGLVRVPTLPCEIVVGGFTQFGGLATFMTQRSVQLVINATHPYAATMSDNAVAASEQTGVPVWRFWRPAWQSQAGDDWREYQNFTHLVEQLKGFKRPLLSAGQLSLAELLTIHQLAGIEQVVWRTAASPAFDVPQGITWLKAIGPFDLAHERSLLQAHDIDVMVTKNSGGEATSAKLVAARELGVRVLLHQRPRVRDAQRTFTDFSQLMTALQNIVARGTIF